MPNRFNYRCPQCGDQDHIDICAFVSVRINRLGAEIIEDENDIGPGHWSAENGRAVTPAASRGEVKDFEPQPARLVSLNEFRRRR
jgi:hypothetical protein